MTEQTTDAPKVRRHWSTKARLILAGIAVAGVGAAITTAAWTDQVWFEADASSSDALNLEGSVDDGATWADSPSETEIELTIPETAFENLSQGENRPFTIAVRNAGAAAGTLTTATAAGTGAIFTPSGDPGAASVSVAPVSGSLPMPIAGSSAEEIEFVVTISTPADWDPAVYAGQTGAITVTITGTSA